MYLDRCRRITVNPDRICSFDTDPWIVAKKAEAKAESWRMRCKGHYPQFAAHKGVLVQIALGDQD